MRRLLKKKKTCGHLWPRSPQNVVWVIGSWMRPHICTKSSPFVIASLRTQMVTWSEQLLNLSASRKMSVAEKTTSLCIEHHESSTEGNWSFPSSLFHVRTVTVEGNPLPERSFHLLLSEDSMWVAKNLKVRCIHMDPNVSLIIWVKAQSEEVPQPRGLNKYCLCNHSYKHAWYMFVFIFIQAYSLVPEK